MPAPGFLPRAAFTCLIDVLTQGGYCCTGTAGARDGSIATTVCRTCGALPRSVHACHAPGSYAVTPGEDPAWASGPLALKPSLLAAREPLWRAERMTPAALTVRGDDARGYPAGIDTTKEVAGLCTPPV